jgi:hypothetical protein
MRVRVATARAAIRTFECSASFAWTDPTETICFAIETLGA